MSLGATSIESAVRTCKVNTGYANKIESDRFLNPNNLVCPLWNGLDTAGRQACPDSFYTKREGCNSAEDRVVVENNVTRPQYMEYVTLNAGGFAGEQFTQQAALQREMFGYSSGYQNMQRQNAASNASNKWAGTFGLVGTGGGWDAEIQGSCGTGNPTAYEMAMAQMNNRTKQSALQANEGYRHMVRAAVN